MGRKTKRGFAEKKLLSSEILDISQDNLLSASKMSDPQKEKNSLFYSYINYCPEDNQPCSFKEYKKECYINRPLKQLFVHDVSYGSIHIVSKSSKVSPEIKRIYFNTFLRHHSRNTLRLSRRNSTRNSLQSRKENSLFEAYRNYSPKRKASWKTRLLNGETDWDYVPDDSKIQKEKLSPKYIEMRKKFREQFNKRCVQEDSDLLDNISNEEDEDSIISNIEGSSKKIETNSNGNIITNNKKNNEFENFIISNIEGINQKMEIINGHKITNEKDDIGYGDKANCLYKEASTHMEENRISPLVPNRKSFKLFHEHINFFTVHYECSKKDASSQEKDENWILAQAPWLQDHDEVFQKLLKNLNNREKAGCSNKETSPPIIFEKCISPPWIKHDGWMFSSDMNFVEEDNGDCSNKETPTHIVDDWMCLPGYRTNQLGGLFTENVIFAKEDNSNFSNKEISTNTVDDLTFPPACGLIQDSVYDSGELIAVLEKEEEDFSNIIAPKCPDENLMFIPDPETSQDDGMFQFEDVIIEDIADF